MRKNEIELKPAISTFTCGTVMTEEEFKSNGIIIPYEKNSDLIDTYARTVSPKVRALEIAKRRFERTGKRREELEKQQQHIQNELAKL